MASVGQRGIGHDLVNVGTLEPEKLHRTVLNRCLPQLLMDLDVNVVMMYIQQKELFDAVTIRDINEQTTTTYKISHLIDQITKRDQNTYVRFKECLILAQRADLKIMLEEEEENLVAEMKEKYRGVDASNTKIPMQAAAMKDMDEPQTKVKNIDSQDKDDVDTPITQEHINFALLCNALTTVCSNALREILLTNAPMPYPDIYKAILANKAKLKNLKKEQVQLVYPYPQGLTTGHVEEFDISLLYTIIRNVSSVPAPSNGWGKPPTDNPRDTTLGASVERIHTYRNRISGHSVDGKISQQEFEDYWVKIDEVLREIETVIGNHGYLEDLEKRKNQAITPHEAHVLQKTFQEYKKQTEAAAIEIDLVVDQLYSVAKTFRGVLATKGDKGLRYMDTTTGAEASKVKSQMLAGAKKELDEPQAKVKNVDGQDKDDVVTQDLINYARLCNALTTVCSSVLREILLTNVPMPYTDIYKAIMANKAKLNKLNKDQVMLVFPDPQGLSTGKVEEFNLFLLYTIIRKVSSVPAPSNGWGNQPADNPRDTTLGANVERIRLYRNEISGHSVDGKISQQKFEDYWAKIGEVLREIEIDIGNHGYLEDLEKCKNQAFTRHEAHELQKKFQEYKINIKGNPLEAVRPVDVLLAIISDKSIETILQMITSLQESEIHDIEIRNVSIYLQHIHKESLTQSERRKEDIFKALFDSCKSDLLNTLKTGEHSDDILRSALQYILPINDPSAKAAILNVAGANLKSKLSNPDCDVWGGLDVRIDSKCRVSLVCLHRGNLNTQPDSHLGLPVLYREYDRIEREPFEASFSDEYHTLISPEDLRRANLLINKHGEELFKKHTNLVAISPSSVLSSKSRGLKIEPSIVLYCRMKGVIPIGENHFPKTLELEGIILSTDIREGLFTFVMREQAQQKPFRPIDRNNKLRMGCSIGRENSNSSGTLGPFVRLGSDVGFITCAHVIGFDKRIVLNQPVVQPADGDSDDSERACGTVLDVHFDPDKPVDAALIKVNNRDVAPTDFTWFNTEEVRNAGFDPTKPPSFLGGSVRMDTGFSDAQGKRVIKCGKKTGLTKGSLALNGIMIRIDDCRFVFPAGITWNEFSAVVMKNQYLVENNRYPFCSCGDSGAGVYLVENEQNNLSLIGILIGLLNDYTIVTPIGPVLESLQLKPEDVIADELVQKTTEIPKSSRSYCTPQ